MAAKKKTEKTEGEVLATEAGAGDRPAFIKDRVEKEAIAGETDAEAARRLRGLKDQKEELERQLKEVNSSIDALSVTLAESMENHGVDSFKVAGVGSVYIQTINRPHIQDQDAFIVWLDERKMGSLAPRTVHWKRLESLVKEMLADAQALPDCLTNFQQKRAVIRRA